MLCYTIYIMRKILNKKLFKQILAGLILIMIGNIANAVAAVFSLDTLMAPLNDLYDEIGMNINFASVMMPSIIMSALVWTAVPVLFIVLCKKNVAKAMNQVYILILWILSIINVIGGIIGFFSSFAALESGWPFFLTLASSIIMLAGFILTLTATGKQRKLPPVYIAAQPSDQYQNQQFYQPPVDPFDGQPYNQNQQQQSNNNIDPFDNK